MDKRKNHASRLTRVALAAALAVATALSARGQDEKAPEITALDGVSSVALGGAALACDEDGALYMLVPETEDGFADGDWRTDAEIAGGLIFSDGMEPVAGRARVGFLSACLADGEESVVRGQGETPPAESPSSTTQITQSSVYSSTPNVVAPPLSAGDEPFQATQIELGENATTFQKMFRYRQQISGGYLFMPRTKNRGLGVNELDARILFAFPCKALQTTKQINNGYFLLTPSFTYDNIALPKSSGASVDMPKSLFDAGITTTFMTSLSDLDVTVDFSTGVASSFKKVTSRAIYFRGRAEAALPIDDEKQVKILGGVAYYDRIKYKLVPIVGLVWNPNMQNELRLVFPNPKWSRYLTKINETDWWFFVHGDIGGDRWLITDPRVLIKGKHTFNIDYDDYRVGAGVSFQCATRLTGSFEVGGAFKRELKSKAGVMYDPKSSVYLKFGLAY